MAKYEKVFEILKRFETESDFLNQIRCPHLSDIENSMDLTTESFEGKGYLSADPIAIGTVGFIYFKPNTAGSSNENQST